MSSNVVCIVAALESDHGAVARHGGVGTDSVNFVRTLVYNIVVGYFIALISHFGCLSPYS